MNEDSFVDSDGVRLAVRHHGGSGQPLVLVHGHFGNLAEFDRLGPLLAQHARVVAYDQRGQGWSERGPVGIEESARDLDAVARSFGTDRPMLFGSSFGTLVCLAYVACGGQVAGLISQDGRAADFAAEPAPRTPPPSPRRILDPGAWEEYVASFGRAGSDGIATAARSGVRRPDGRWEVRPSPEDVIAKEEAFVRLPVIASYQRVAAPVMMLAAAPGGRRRPQREEELRLFCEATGAEVRWFPTGHWISAEDPGGVAEAVGGLIRRTSQR